MKNILVIGAGRSAVTLIEYLLNESVVFNWKVTIADYNIELAKDASLNHKNSRAILFNINDVHQRENEIKEADIVVSMLPTKMHSIVANDCVKFRKNLVTASYVSDEIKELDNIARKHQIILLNEIGLDPGIDHMSAMKAIDDLKFQGAYLKSFKSYCGGLIHPDFDNNPWNYKFTWNPRNVILAGQVGVIGHLVIGSSSTVAAKSVVFQSIPSNSFISGIPARAHKERMRQDVLINQLPDILDRIRNLEK